MTSTLVELPIPPVPSAQSFDTKGSLISQPWQQWFVNVRDKVNAINSIIISISGSSSTLQAFNSLSPLSSNGDILSYLSGNNIRVPVGTSGQVLTVISGSPKWQTPTVYTTTYIGTGPPSALYNNGDIYFDKSVTPYTGYVQDTGVWQKFS